MPEEIEDLLRQKLASSKMPAVPEDLYGFLDSLKNDRPPPPVARSVSKQVAGVSIVFGLLTIAILSSNSPQPGEQTVASAAAGSSPVVLTSPSPETVRGLPILSVGDLLAARLQGSANDGPFALRGYWSNRSKGEPCHGYGADQPGDLEIVCGDGEWGITQDPESIRTVVRTVLGNDKVVTAAGPHLTPWVPPGNLHSTLWDLPGNWSPVPIIVVGHFDDPLAAECRVPARQKCLNRFVVDEVVAFDPSAAPSPTAMPSPTPFPVSSPPLPPFAEAAWDGRCYGDAPKSFVGWSKLGDLDIAINPGWDAQGFVYAVVTRDAVPIGDPTLPDEDTWHESADYPGHQIRWWGRRVCLAEEPGTLYSKSIIGSTYIEIDDGRLIEAPYPFG